MEDIEKVPVDNELKNPEKPGPLKIIVPFVTTALIFWWIFRGIDIERLKIDLAKAELGLAIPVMAVYCFVFFFVDIISFGYGYKRYLTDRVSWKEITVVRGGMYLIQVAMAPVAEVIPPTYFLRRWRVGVLRTIGTELFVLFCDAYCNVVLLTAGLAMAGLAIGVGWLYFVMAMWLLLALTWLYWLTPLHEKILSRLREATVMHAYRKATMRQYFALFGMRGILALSNLVAGWALLDALDVRLPLEQLMLLMPVMLLSTFLPISAGGYGGPQGAAVLLLVTLWGVTSREIATAYSLLWSTFFALGRAAIGAVLTYPVWMLLQRKPVVQGDDDAEDTATEQPGS